MTPQSAIRRARRELRQDRQLRWRARRAPAMLLAAVAAVAIMIAGIIVLSNRLHPLATPPQSALPPPGTVVAMPLQPAAK
jgi:hypothetical protein